MALKFLNKKGWHTGSLRNVENVWKAEQKNEAEQKKLEELRKQIQEERERAEFRQLQESAGFATRQERLDFLYESGLGVGKGSSEGFKALQSTPKAEASGAATSADAASKTAAPGALFEEKPQSANDSWRKLHSDPLLLIRQREQEALARIRNNPVQMAMIRKSAEAERKHKENGARKEKKRKKEHKRKHSKHKAISDSDSHDSTEHKEATRNREHSTYDRWTEAQAKHKKGSSRAYKDFEEVNKETGGKRKRDDLTPGGSKETEGRRYRDWPPPAEVSKAKHDKHSFGAYSDTEYVNKEMEGKRKRGSKPQVSNKIEWRRNRSQSPPWEVNKEMKRSRQRDNYDLQVHEGLWNEQHKSSVCSHSGDVVYNKKRGKNICPSSDQHYSGRGGDSEYRHNSYKHCRAAPKISEEERAARLREMQVNAELHEEQRWTRLKKASEADLHEANKDKQSLGSRNFLEAAQKSIYGTEKGGSSTIEESVRRRTYFSQGGTEATENNAFRR